MMLISLFLYIVSFVTTLGPITFVYIPEVIQPSKVPYAVALDWLVGALVVFLFPIVRNSCGNVDCPSVFLFLSICMGIGLVVCYFLMV